MKPERSRKRRVLYWVLKKSGIFVVLLIVKENFELICSNVEHLMASIWR